MSMRALTSLVVAFGLVLAAGSTGFAQKGKKDDKPKVKVYDFSGDTIDGELIKPEGENIDSRDITQFSSLIRIRRDFIAEIIKAAEDL
jgi:hypothetical protein